MHNFNLGLKCQKQKEFLKALKAYLAIIQGYPDHMKANLNAGSICFMYEKYEDAVKYWSTAFLIDSYNQKNTANLAIAYDKLEQFSYAYCFYKRFLDFEVDEKSFEKVKIEERMVEIEKLLGDKNAYYSSHYSKAESFSKDKEYLKALVEYENCNLLKPDNEELIKKIEVLQATMFPEDILSLRYMETGSKALEKLDISVAMHCFKTAYDFNPHAEHISELKQKMYRCAKIIEKLDEHHQKI
jgi:tetratricopeptide (TPR) repeat protein